MAFALSTGPHLCVWEQERLRGRQTRRENWAEMVVISMCGAVLTPDLKEGVLLQEHGSPPWPWALGACGPRVYPWAAGSWGGISGWWQPQSV